MVYLVDLNELSESSASSGGGPAPERLQVPTVFLAPDAASYVTGTVLFADGGWTAIDGRFTPPGM
jgi:NAD(P)-dependent dehydrogenase (short-subunit alcohol dehydrogenase family)